MKLSLELPQDTACALALIQERTGFPPELAAQYAMRLVAACISEGLLEEEPSAAWPREAHAHAQADGRVLLFPARGRKTARPAGRKAARKE